MRHFCHSQQTPEVRQNYLICGDLEYAITVRTPDSLTKRQRLSAMLGPGASLRKRQRRSTACLASSAFVRFGSVWRARLVDHLQVLYFTGWLKSNNQNDANRKLVV